MTGGTLVISREELNHSYFKKRFEALGFNNVTLTALEKDALYFLIRDLKPSLVMMGASFYQCCTPFLMGELRKTFPKINMAALCFGQYPPEIAMYFILNGINSYVTSFDGIEQFYDGLNDIAKGKEYISPSVVERIELRREYPEPAGKITDRHREVIRLICCGFRDIDIAQTMAIAKSTVENHKTEIYTSLNINNAIELVRAALTLEIVKLEELYFYPKNLTVNPRPDKGRKISVPADFSARSFCGTKTSSKINTTASMPSKATRSKK
jgi:DNA-binding NarL/FixJ family response regulator